jgi:hypothetical protein
LELPPGCNWQKLDCKPLVPFLSSTPKSKCIGFYWKLEQVTEFLMMYLLLWGTSYRLWAERALLSVVSKEDSWTGSLLSLV